MSGKTKIQWCDKTWNPIRGCSRVSEGCRNCYAEKVAARFSGPGQPYEGLATRGPARWTGKVQLVEKHLADPLRWRDPSRIFVNSMSDLFHEALPDEAIDRVFAVMALAPRHTFQVLTKRPERMREYIVALDPERLAQAAERDWGDEGGVYVSNWINGWSRPRGLPEDGNPLDGSRRRWPLPNVWLGVSVEDQATADARIPLLLRTPAAVRFVSYEPALGPVTFMPWWMKAPPGPPDPPTNRARHLDWVIVGGESGPGARPFDVAWARSVIAQCKAAGVPVFVKQLGADPRETAREDQGSHLDDWPDLDVDNEPQRAGPSPGGGQSWAIPLRDRKGGDMDEWPADLRVREFPPVKP
ncbi:MAG: phage Gp37/Gp68 family protein [Gemmatimonadaceae bacterium]|nr:phage Gp37/Gp68 family protein [Gemmatimonadaceae bacterium]